MSNQEQLIKERQDRDNQLVNKLSAKYGLNIRQFLSVSKNWHKGLEWDVEKINKSLKCCPFCGGKAELVEYEYEDGLSYSIQCTECYAESDECDYRVEAILKWNKRI